MIDEQKNEVDIVEHIPIDLKERNSDATYCFSKELISLNLRRCKFISSHYNIDFIEFIARCVNHEFMHHVFYVEHGVNVSHALDVISRQYMEYWMW